MAIGGLSSLDATPMLRLVSATVGPISIAPGANGVNQTVEAYNAGDGTLSLILSSSSSSASWLTPFVGAPRACTTTTAATSCIPLTFALNTASLAASATPYTGVITVMAPNAVDAPQTITVTVLIGGAVPPSVNVYVPPNTTIADANSVDVSFSLGAASCPNLNGCLTGQTTTQDGANWLRLTLSGAGSFQTTLPYTIVITPQATNTAGNTYTGTLVTSGSSFGPDNKTIPVTMNVTTLPIAQPSVTQVTPTVQLAPGAPALPQYIVLSNLGQGALAIGGVTASGSGITATFSGSLVTVTLDPTGLSPNIYTGSVSIASNAANSPTIIPVTFQAVAAGAPTIFYQGVVDDAVFGGSGFTVTPGDVIALFGQELSFQQPVIGPMPPLQYVLGGSSVSVNGEAAPLYYSSYGQINFQIPVDIPTGTALVQVANEPNPLLPLALAGNTVSVNVAARAPRLLLLYGTGGYGAIEDASQGYSLPFPSSISIPAFVTQPASPGDVLTIFAIGLGATSPAVATGQPAPAVEPLARLTVTPSVVFTTKLAGPNVQTIVPPSSVAYAGLSPYYAGLYQINVAIPQNCPLGTVEVSLTFPDSSSNPVNIQV
ncbi:MAG TPA: hypothetical protein VGF03_06760, partial [Bryobacteraceae bacterium]